MLDTDFAGYALQQRQLIEELLTRRKPAWWRAGRERRDSGEQVGLHSPDVGDPEFRMNLRIFLRLVGEAAELHDRAARAAPPGLPPTAINRLGDLRQSITLSSHLPLTLQLLMARRFELERLLIEIGDQTYLTGRLADLYNEQLGSSSTWQSMYGTEPPALLPKGVGHTHPIALPEGFLHDKLDMPGSERPGEWYSTRPSQAITPDDVEATRRQLLRLMQVKESEDEDYRARSELNYRAVRLAAAVLLLVMAVFAAATARMTADDRAMWAAAAGGAAGGALGLVWQLRRLTVDVQVRQLPPAFLSQMLIGVGAGLVTFLVDQAGIITIAGEAAGIAAVGFALGFSQAAFLRLLERLSSLVVGGERGKGD